MLCGLPCVAPSNIQVYGEYLEKCAFVKRNAIVDAIVWPKLKSCGVATQHDQGVLIATVLVADDFHLRNLRAMLVPAIIDGKSASHYLSTRAGNLKSIEVAGEKADSLSCCGVLKGHPHRHGDCIAFLARCHAKTELRKKLAPQRENLALVSVRA